MTVGINVERAVWNKNAGDVDDKCIVVRPRVLKWNWRCFSVQNNTSPANNPIWYVSYVCTSNLNVRMCINPICLMYRLNRSYSTFRTYLYCVLPYLSMRSEKRIYHVRRVIFHIDLRREIFFYFFIKKVFKIQTINICRSYTAHYK